MRSGRPVRGTSGAARKRVQQEARLMLAFYVVFLGFGGVFAAPQLVQFWLLPLVWGSLFAALSAG